MRPAAAPLPQAAPVRYISAMSPSASLVDPRRVAALAAGGSAALLAGALAFQYIGGYPPCELCHWQRYPHVAVIGLGLLAAAVARRPERRAALLVLAAAGLAISAGIALYHVGVEWKWWGGPAACSGGIASGLPLEELRRRLLGAPVVRCDEIPWSLFGVSMAGWNFLISGALALAVSAGAWIAARRAA